MNFYYLNLEILNDELSNYSNTKEYSNIIFKNLSFKDRVKSFLKPEFKFINTKDINFQVEEEIVIWTSNIVFIDDVKIKLFVDKLYHSQGSFMWGSKEGFIYKGTKNDFEAENYKIFTLEPFLIEIFDFQSYRNLLEISLDTREFNEIEKAQDIYIKKSQNLEKIEMEYKFLSSVPESLKNFFISVHSFKQSGTMAQYSMPRINYLDISKRHVNGELSQKDIASLFQQLTIYFEKLIEHKFIMSDEPFDFISEKTKNRIITFESLDIYQLVDNVFNFSSNYKSIDVAFTELNFFLEKNRKAIHKKGSVISHGDLCFSNILASQNFQDLILIDPMGGLFDDSVQSIYYDFAKLSHSIMGGYDLIINGLAELKFDENMEIFISFKKENNMYLEEAFLDLLDKFGLNVSITRLVEASLFLSMLPLHTENHMKTAMLALRGSEILAQLVKSKTI